MKQKQQKYQGQALPFSTFYVITKPMPHFAMAVPTSDITILIVSCSVINWPQNLVSFKTHTQFYYFSWFKSWLKFNWVVSLVVTVWVCSFIAAVSCRWCWAWSSRMCLQSCDQSSARDRRNSGVKVGILRVGLLSSFSACDSSLLSSTWFFCMVFT